MAKQYVFNKYKTEVVIRTPHILGQGSYATVSKAYLDGVEIAIKSFKNQIGGSCLYNEINILSRVSHANVIKLVGVIEEEFETSPKLLLEYLGNGSLAQFSQNQSLTELQELKLLQDVAKGMTYIHDMDVIHRDLACRNVIIDTLQNAKITDFGFSILLPQTYPYNQRFEFTVEELSRIPYRHMPKEAVEGLRKNSIIKSTYSKSLDVYSFGVLIWELLSPRKQPYERLSNHQKDKIFEEICNGNNPAKFELVTILHESVHYLMLSCFMWDESSRPTFGWIRQRIEQHLMQIPGNLETSSQAGHSFVFKCPAPLQTFSKDLLFNSTSADSGFSGSTSCSELDDCEMQTIQGDSNMDSAIVFQNMSTVLPDKDFSEAVFKKFGRPDIKLSGLRRLSSRSIAIGFKSRAAGVGTSHTVKNSIEVMVNQMKLCPDVWQRGVKVIPVFKPALN